MKKLFPLFLKILAIFPFGIISFFAGLEVTDIQLLLVRECFIRGLKFE